MPDTDSAEPHYYRGEGGHIIGFDPERLAIDAPLQEQIAAGRLTRVNGDGTPFTDGASKATKR